MMSATPLHRSGAAGGMLATARLIGQTAGAMAMAVFFHLAGTHAAVAALATASGIAGAAALVSLSRLRVAEKSGPTPEPVIGEAS
jgi:DHA2 family multidrug resistance protein-like MFS transporter